MYQIIIKGLSGKTKNVGLLSSIEEIQCKDNFVDYIDKELKDLGLIDGFMSFEIEEGRLYTITTYISEKKLTKKQLKLLGEYTQGQWSDGIGEGFEQFSCAEIDGNEVYISPWYFGQELFIEQISL